MPKTKPFRRPKWWGEFTIETPRTLSDLWKATRPHGWCCYRGLSDPSFTLTPRVARDANHQDNEWNMMQEFLAHARSHGHALRNNLEYLALAQHHGLPTRCMDVTYSFGVALYFATAADPEANENGAAVWCIDIDRMSWVPIKWYRKLAGVTKKLSSEYVVFQGPPTIGPDGLQIVPITTDSRIDGEIDRIMTDVDPPKPRHPPILLSTPHISNRMSAQDAMFLLLDPNGGDLASQLSELRCQKVLRGIYLSPRLCGQVREHLKRLGISERLLFPDIDHVASDITKTYCSSD